MHGAGENVSWRQFTGSKGEGDCTRLYDFKLAVVIGAGRAAHGRAGTVARAGICRREEVVLFRFGGRAAGHGEMTEEDRLNHVNDVLFS